MTKPLIPVTPALPVAAYLGGKKNLATRIIARLAVTPHETYVEPFVGMGGVFLRRPFRAYAEVINDISGDVATLFRVLQRHYEAFMDMLRWQLTSREEFARLLSLSGESLTDLERAARFLYVQRLAFGGKLVGRNFGVSVERPARFDVGRLAPMLEAVHERLASVTIERLPWQELLRRYDRPETLFYLDPPYWGSERDYGATFSRADFEEMAITLRSLKGRWMLSLNDRREVRALFKDFAIEAVTTSYTVSGSGAQKVGELLISRGVSEAPNAPLKRL